MCVALVLLPPENLLQAAEFALRLRIEEARRRLAAGGATVTGVALDLGFSSSQYFASSFKRLTRMTPREVMKKSR
jgi:AraC-like DNA-binding protein